MILPSYIPRYDSVDLIDLDTYDYRIVVDPHDGTAVWDRLLELERRLVLFDWLLAAVRKPGRNVRLFSDFAGAYLYSMEAAIGDLAVTYGGSIPTDQWLHAQPEYDLVLKGLRTLRHREAHVASTSVVPGDVRGGFTTLFAGGESGATVAWHFREITSSEYDALRTPKLGPDEIDGWNTLTRTELALSMMQRTTRALYQMAVRLRPPT